MVVCPFPALMAGLLAVFSIPVGAANQAGVFRAGARAIDITPTNFPVIVNGGFLQKTATKAFDPLHARCLVLDDGFIRLAIVVVDTCMVPRELCDEAKELARKATGIPTDRMLISATHTHSAPAVMACLGTSLDVAYAKWLPGKISEGVAIAVKNLEPARIGWTTVDDWEHTNCRRWIMRPDKVRADPFGEKSVRAMMHPGYQNPDYVGPSGPIDPGLSLLSVQARDGRPLALLANYSMHYFSSPALSADYYGKFAEGIGKLINARGGGAPFVGIMSQGTSGDSHWMDYSQPKKDITLDSYSEGVMRVAANAHAKIKHHDWVSLAMAETKLTLKRRVAYESRLAWARKIVSAMGDRIPTNQIEVYAREQLLIAAEPKRELKLQALRIGELGITAIPNEVFAITGLKLKAQSPLPTTFNIELANGGDGYIPPPEQHKLGGYTTWAARTAGLEEQAEPQIVEALLGLLEKVARQPRRAVPVGRGQYAEMVLASKPAAYWRLDEFVPDPFTDLSGRRQRASLEHGVAVYLPGAQTTGGGVSGPPQFPSPFAGNAINRAPHFAGGRLKLDSFKAGDTYSVEFWFWNGFPNDARPVTGYLCSLGANGDKQAAGDHLGIGGTAGKDRAGRLFFFNGNARNEVLTGRTLIEPKTWHHVALVRSGNRVAVYLDGNLQPEFDGEINSTVPANATFFLGGRCDNFANFEGKLDEVAVFDRALTSGEAASHFALARP